ncbi:hypothetical protein [Mycobacterium sp.]|uniref:hypothetical protein n=1 Tax=Mycobacterium sp. TaxID=1785 RepID=UPI0025D4E0CC|nr:hypothetical protein [Mycobacterium sp.]
MTDTAPATRPTRGWTRWLYPSLAVTGIAVGVFIIVAGVYLVFVHPSAGHPAPQDCCKSMEADMKKMMDDPKMPMNKPPMSSMPSAPPGPGMAPMPSASAPTP